MRPRCRAAKRTGCRAAGYNENVRRAEKPFPSALPGADIVEAGLRDLAAGIDSIPALLTAIGAPRLRRLGFDVPRDIDSPERRLYAALQETAGDAAHSQYNALIRRLVSFERSCESVS